MAEPVVVTPGDVQQLNRTAIVRSSFFVRIAGTVLVVVGILGAAAWLWTAVRTQQQVSDRNLSFGTTDGIDLDPVDRVDLFAPNFFILVIASVCAGFGLMLRTVAHFMVDRVGGSITGFEPGDTLADAEADASDEVVLEPLPRPE